MSMQSKKELPPKWKAILAKAKCKNLTEFSRKSGVGVMTLRRLAFDGLMPEAWLMAQHIADAAEITTDELFNGDIDEPDESDEQIAS